jgi:membrane-bound serine protease (ClpP class)
MSFLFDPNVAYLLLVLGFVLGVLALFTPGTGLLEVGALFAIALATYALYHLAINWWALIMIVVSIAPFFLAMRKQKNWYWLILSIALLCAGSILLFKQSVSQQPINPFFAILTSLVSAALLWFIGRRSIDALKMRPSQDLKRLVGQVGEARTEIKTTGTIYVNGEEWSARSEKLIRNGAAVKVVDREGLVLIVLPVSEDSK